MRNNTNPNLQSSSLPAIGNDAVEILVNDHEMIKSLLGELVQATGADERQDILDELKAALTIHNATEENLIYPALNKFIGDKDESNKLFHETAEADVLVFELDTMLKEGNDGAFQRKVETLQTAVHAHIEEEEGEAFPSLLERSDRVQAEMLTDAVRQFRGALRFEPTDA